MDRTATEARTRVQSLCDELTAFGFVKRDPALSYIEVQHPKLGAMTVGVEYEPGELADEFGPATAEDVTVHQVLLNGHDFMEYLTQEAIDALNDLALAAVVSRRADAELAAVEVA